MGEVLQRHRAQAPRRPAHQAREHDPPLFQRGDPQQRGAVPLPEPRLALPELRRAVGEAAARGGGRASGRTARQGGGDGGPPASSTGGSAPRGSGASHQRGPRQGRHRGHGGRARLVRPLPRGAEAVRRERGREVRELPEDHRAAVDAHPEREGRVGGRLPPRDQGRQGELESQGGEMSARRVLAVTVACGVLAAGEASAWPSTLMESLNRDARRLVPRTLARLMAEREKEIFEEARAFPAELAQAMAADLGTGTLRPETVAALDARAFEASALLREQKVTDGIVKLGALLRIPADLSDPVLSAGP